MVIEVQRIVGYGLGIGGMHGLSETDNELVWL